jgi:hypothetical protein
MKNMDGEMEDLEGSVFPTYQAQQTAHRERTFLNLIRPMNANLAIKDIKVLHQSLAEFII